MSHLIEIYYKKKKNKKINLKIAYNAETVL